MTRSYLVHNFAGPGLALMLLAGMFTTMSWHLTPIDAGDYHLRVREAVDRVPYVIGDWIGRDVPVPAEATELLRPNTILSREYIHSVSGERVQVLLVHCLDARDLQGHYPPVCYPGIGWRTTERDVRELPADDDAYLPVSWYHFERLATTGTQHLEVLNLMVLPDGGFGTDMRSVDRAAGSHSLRHFGAAQMQLLPEPETSPQRQAELWTQFFRAFKPALEVIQSGSGPGD